jgi:hypothetical protein
VRLLCADKCETHTVTACGFNFLLEAEERRHDVRRRDGHSEDTLAVRDGTECAIKFAFRLLSEEQAAESSDLIVFVRRLFAL